MSERPTGKAAKLLDDFDRDASLVARVGRAVDIYRHLLSKASHTGLVMCRVGNLLEDARVSPADLHVQLQTLVEASLIKVLSPAPFLAIRITSWPGQGSVLDQNPSKISSKTAPLQEKVPVSSSSFQQREVGGPGEGEALLREVIGALDEVDPAEFRELLAQYPPAIIRQALNRVAATPPHRIRKSKAALFRYLLTKFASPTHVTH